MTPDRRGPRRIVASTLATLAAATLVIAGAVLVLPRLFSIAGSVAPASAALVDERAWAGIDPTNVVVASPTGATDLCSEPGASRHEPAPSCPAANELASIPNGTQLRATAARDRWIGYEKARWLRVEYAGTGGWVEAAEVEVDG